MFDGNTLWVTIVYWPLLTDLSFRVLLQSISVFQIRKIAGFVELVERSDYLAGK